MAEKFDPEFLKRLAAMVGVQFDDERAEALVSQAEAHFGLTSYVNTQDVGEFEIAPLRLDSIGSGT